MVRQSVTTSGQMERIPYLGKHIGTYREPKGLPLARLIVLPEGETNPYVAKGEEEESFKKERSIPARTEGDKGPNICVRVGPSDVAART